MVDNPGNTDNFEDVEALEEIDETSEVTMENSSLRLLPSIESLCGSYDRCVRPVMLLDSNLTILYRNEAFTNDLGKFYPDGERYFPAVFQAALENDTVSGLCRALNSPQAGFAWKGQFQSKMKGSTTRLSRIYIYPFFDTSIESARPTAFTVFFDDITAENRLLLRTMFMGLLEASKLKDNDTGKHIERVNLYSRRMAEELYDHASYPQVDMDFLEDIGFLAAMHDVGKIGTPDDILNKTGPLTPWEWEIMKEHTINGAFILSTYPNPMAREIALAHHEMWDGKGYPYHLEGAMIPLSARIVTIADVYDALRTKRSYKPAYSHDVAINKISEWRGNHFDPSLLSIFESIEGDMDKIYNANTDETVIEASAEA